MWNTARTIGAPLETFFKSEALTFAIQDGLAAGQTVPHVHIHVVPRKHGDFARNDQVYDELDKSDARRHVAVDVPEERKSRSAQQMAEEAVLLRPLFTSPLPIPRDEVELSF